MDNKTLTSKKLDGPITKKNSSKASKFGIILIEVYIKIVRNALFFFSRNSGKSKKNNAKGKFCVIAFEFLP